MNDSFQPRFEETAKNIESILDSKDDFRMDYMGISHVIVLEVTPISAFKDKAGMSYEEFKTTYPNFVNWIEENGWTYSKDRDTSLMKQKRKQAAIETGVR